MSLTRSYPTGFSTPTPITAGFRRLAHPQRTEDIDYAGYRQVVWELHPARHGAALFLPGFDYDKPPPFTEPNQGVADCARF